MSHLPEKRHMVPLNCDVSQGRFWGTEFWRLWIKVRQKKKKVPTVQQGGNCVLNPFRQGFFPAGFLRCAVHLEAWGWTERWSWGCTVCRISQTSLIKAAVLTVLWTTSVSPENGSVPARVHQHPHIHSFSPPPLSPGCEESEIVLTRPSHTPQQCRHALKFENHWFRLAFAFLSYTSCKLLPGPGFITTSIVIVSSRFKVLSRS